jgi:hypothetical protein
VIEGLKRVVMDRGRLGARVVLRLNACHDSASRSANAEQLRSRILGTPAVVRS